MIYLSGVVNQQVANDVGWMLTPMMGNRPDLSVSTWAADTGCFSAPEKFSVDSYLSWLAERSEHSKTCLFATAPDVVGDAILTMEKSFAVLPKIRALGFKAALVAQDGLENMEVPWEEIDCLFIGGTTKWKLSEDAFGLVSDAKAHDKWVHMGRVNSLRRMRVAASVGVDSVDGTFLAFGPDKNAPRLRSWLSSLRNEPPMPLTGRRGETE